MLFASQVFLIAFLPAVLALYYLAAGRARLRIWLLIVASLVFYGYWDLRLVPLLLASVGVNWLFARAIGEGAGRWHVVAGVGLNLLVLGIFKYADFFAGNLEALFGLEHRAWGIVLPLGISFFTFQQVSYLVDRARDRAPLYRFDDYALFVTFFPQLIAGPIVRHNEIILQYALHPLRPGFDERFSRGLTLLVIGLAKKTLLADQLAPIADPLYAASAAGTALGTIEAWLAAIAFGFQIYFDFSGYSDMAIGLGLLFGFALPLNFNAPYRSISIREFWRRWHMTLSRFLRDYLYIPLGGNRHGVVRMMLALMATMLLGGLWHGAAWTFVVWGGMHGLALAVQRAWGQAGIALPRVVGWAATMLVVFLAWVMFRAESFASAWSIWAAMAGGGEGGIALAIAEPADLWLIALCAFVVLALPVSQRLALERLRPSRLSAAAAGAALLYVTLLVGGGRAVEFIYFQF
ncbi:MAG: MBOAT family protein [Rhodospirillaceae bacterium]|jgi:alginate O-acetyltransferase complex protein AlgI|nr:MBOAT family protein [Rhodospirillaceae bacterium]MBT6117850.1 MBOAT family protein [Rhodospirillaceae bacterium]